MVFTVYIMIQVGFVFEKLDEGWLGGVNPKDPNDLAEKMWSLWTNRDVDAEQKLMEQAIKDIPLRRLEFA